jgi:hypothetical protein
MVQIDWARAVMTRGQSAAVSEGFCEPCRTRLGDPSIGMDGGSVVMATQCPACGLIYMLLVAG